MKKFAIALSLCLGMATAAHAEIRYSITGVEAADGYADNVWAINQGGSVTGSFLAGGTQEAFVFNGTDLTRLGTGGTAVGLGRTINDQGVVGGTFGTGAESRPFLFNGTSTLDLTTVDANVLGSGVLDVNNNGEAMLYGFSVVIKSPFCCQPVVKNFYYDGNTATDLLPLSTSKMWLSLNDDGDRGGATLVAGVVHPIIDAGSGITYLPGTDPLVGHVFALNEQGWATGAGNLGNGVHAFLYNGTTMIDLGTLAPLSASFRSWGQAINGLGTVVGYSSHDGAGTHAFIHAGSAMEDLNGLIDPSSGWLLTSAQGINDAGQIVGVGIFNGQQRGFVLNPLAAVPEPSSWAMMIAGFAVVGAGLRRRRISAAMSYAMA